MSELYKSTLEQLLRKNYKHDVGNVIDVLPFLSKRTRALRDRFNKVLGDYVRNLNNLKLDSSSIKRQEFKVSEEENEFSEHIADKVEFSSEDDKHDFVRFLDQYLFNKEEIKLIHPYLFNYIKVEKKDKNEYSKYAQFMSDTLVINKQELMSVFNNKETNDIMTELVLSQLDILKETEEKERKYMPLLKPLSQLYQEDVVYLSKYKDYFLTSFPLITHFYVFMYTCQLVVKFERFTSANYEKLDPLYFTLEWESLSKRRKAADHLESFRYIKGRLENLFPHIHTLSHLSHNKANASIEEIESREKSINVLTYTDIKSLVDKGELNEEKLFEEIKEWIQMYSDIFNIEHQATSTNLSEAMEELFNRLKTGMSSTVSKKYGGNVEDLGANQFIKNRGSLGQVLNIKHDFLLLLTAVSVKDTRIPLNELFNQFEMRGIVLDRYSKKEVVKLLDNLNIIDKKSDSGDAQYVKPIL
ncbi:DNA phosphorothioation-dependent restriction protein DptG [Oceanobacillus kapialis]|uniref:DNA phosphorothioation-dependent restriction protein DptG n=1 Tax=Oceanobacillus kapialis TaxID=481353 RepID=UPI00384B9BB9